LSALFAVYYGAALVLVVAEALGLGRRYSVRVRSLRRVQQSSATPFIVALIVSYALELALVWLAATHQSVLWVQPWRLTLPLTVVTRDMQYPNAVSAVFLTLSALQCVLLWEIYRRAVDGRVLLVAAVTMLALSLAAPSLISFDPYSYAADAYLGRAAYIAQTALPGEYRVVSEAFSYGAVPPAPYGPLWLLIARVATAWLPTLLSKLLALRIFGALCLISVVAAMKRLGLPRRLLVVTMLNPALALLYVMNAHNDLCAVALIAWAAVWLFRSRVAAVVLIAAAALIKLPFAILALPVLRPIQPAALRAGYAFIILVLALGLSWVTGGREYFSALAAHAPTISFVNALNLAAGLAALAAVITAAVNRPKLRSAVWLMPMMGSYPTPWYFTWGFGYAVRRHRVLAYLMILLPIASAVVDTTFMQVWSLLVVVPLLVALQVFSVSRL
jgi:hypothetical protein